MIINERITTYIHSLDSDNCELLEELRVYAELHNVPIIRRETENFIRVMLRIKNPLNILEIGTAIAYSSIFMAVNSNAKIITIENYDKRICLAADNIKKACMNDRIKLLEGDALRILKELNGGFDFIFLDAAKGQYIEMLDDITRLLNPGGLLIADNILQDGELVDSRFVTERRQRTIHERMRMFLWEIKHSDKYDTSLLTIGDGVSLSVKK